LQQEERQSRRVKQQEEKAALEAQINANAASSSAGTNNRGKQTTLRHNTELKSSIREVESKIVQTKTGSVKLKVRERGHL
jgi:hypothetical protein